MTEQDQRIVIAEACGWTGMNSDEADDGFRDENGVWHSVPPDYLHDLNAMHEAENVKTIWRSPYFLDNLHHVILPHRDKMEWSFEVDGLPMIHATATQRAEAFLRTIGKWKEETK